MSMTFGTTDSGSIQMDPLVVRDLADEILVGECDNTGRTFVDWQVYQSDVYRCAVDLESDEAGGYSVYVPHLPGVVSEGETEASALENIRKALAAALETYIGDGQSIPWIDAAPVDSSSVRRWVVVHV